MQHLLLAMTSFHEFVSQILLLLLLMMMMMLACWVSATVTVP